MARISLNADTLAGPENLPNTTDPRRLDLFKRREAAEPAEKPCQVCGVTKATENFKRVPVGGRANTCDECIRGKMTKNQRRLADPKTVIAEELWSQYDDADRPAEKIRCLEALTKLQNVDEEGEGSSKLSDAQVIQSMMRSLKARRKSSGE